tara:strand:- start:261 stop:872 length:612 start_codon:yes stop_codon:yes gene_type:complete
MFFTYTSINNNTKLKNNVIVAKYVPRPTNFEPPRSVYSNIEVKGRIPIERLQELSSTYNTSTNNKFSKQLKHPQRNPIKHYRKQLVSDSSIYSRHIEHDLDKPGKNIVKNTENCTICDNDKNIKLLKQQIYPNETNISKCIGYYNTDEYLWKYTGNNQNTCRTRRARPIITSNYSSNTQNYLERKNKSYHKNNHLINNFPCEC